MTSAWAGDPALAEVAPARTFAYFDRYYAAYLPAYRQTRILDFGCGFGSFLAYLESRGYRNLLGVDVDPRCVDFCVRHGLAAVRFEVDSRAFLRAHPAEFDLILVREVACYFAPGETADYLCALRMALKPAGRLIVEVFNGALLTGMYPSLNDHWIVKVFTEHSLRAALLAAGFKVTNLFGASGAGTGARYKGWRAASRLWAAALRAVYLLERGRDSLNPTIFDKNLVAVAEPQA